MNNQQDEFRLALVQMKVEGGKPLKNLQRAEARIEEAKRKGADIVLLPEAMDLGWTHSSAKIHAGEIPGGASFAKLAEISKQNSIFVCAGIIEKEENTIYNSAVLIDDNGKLLLKHRKINELDIAHDLYAQGDRLGVCHTKFGTIGLLICADANAKDWTLLKSLGYMGADIVLSPCSWAVPPAYDNNVTPYGDTWRDVYGPASGSFQYWIAGVSNVGKINDGPWKDWDCIGSSMVYNPSGREEVLMPFGVDADTIVFLEIKIKDRPARGTGWGSIIE